MVASWDQGVQGVGVCLGSEPVGGAGIYYGRLALESHCPVVHASVIKSDFPAVVIHSIGVTELAFEFGSVDPTKCDLPVSRAVRASVEVNADDFLFQVSLFVQGIHQGLCAERV